MQPERRHACAAKPPAAAVTAEALAQQLAATQAAGSAAAQGVLQQLRKRFVPSSLMEAYGLVQPQYSLAPNPEERCKRDLEVLIAKYGEERCIEQAAPAAAPAVGSRAAATAAAAAESAAEEAVAAAAAVRQEHLAGGSQNRPGGCGSRFGRSCRSCPCQGRTRQGCRSCCS